MNWKKLLFELDLLDAIGLGRFSRRNRILNKSERPAKPRRSIRHMMARGPILFIPFWRRRAVRDQVISQIRALIGCNAPLAEGLEKASDQASDVASMVVLLTLSRTLHQGATLADSMRGIPAIFPGHYIDLIDAGERTGRIRDALEAIYQHNVEMKPIRMVLGSWAMYFTFLACLFLVVLSYLLTFVLPQFSEMAREFSTTNSNLYIQSVQRAENLILIVNILTYFGIAMLSLVFRRVRSVLKGLLQGIAHYLPVFRTVVVSANMAHASGVLACLLRVNVPAHEALAQCGRLSLAPRYRRAFQRLSESTEKGVTLAKSLEKERAIPPSFGVLANVGECSGLLPEMMSRASEWYRLLALRYGTVLAKAICPLGVLVFAGIVLAVQLAVYEANVAIADVLANPDAVKQISLGEEDMP
ncbi:MAG: hypothetical protein AMXMBFR84_24360 [Candidatus Hydrogenedentota bacterium]